MPRGRKPGTKLSEEHKKSLSKALLGNTAWNKGHKAVKPVLSYDEIANKEIERKEKILKRNQHAALSRKLNTVLRYVNSAPSEWAEVEAVRTDAVHIKMRHVPCGTALNVQAQTVRKWNWGSGLCKTCNPVFRGISAAETDLFKFVSSITNQDAIRHFRIDGTEYDILIPSKKLLIEYDGLYWHSEKAGYDKKKHLDKTIKAEANDYQLIHVFEDEWIKKRDIVESRLKSLFGANSRIYARKTEVVELSSKEAREFFNTNHIQGYTSSSVRLGLMSGGKIVAAMTFAKPRYDREYDWELIRFANNIGINVVGGAGKLLSAFRSLNGGSILSYADRRWSRGKVYESLGFEQIGTSSPSYWYFKGDLRKNRQTFQKAKLKELPNYDAAKTEVDIMLEAGWNRIWDCGNLIFALRK